MNLRNLRLGSTPVTIGLIFGVILAFVLVLYGFIAVYVNQVLGSISIFLNLAIYILFGFLAGRRASRLTGKLSSGVVAGLLAGLVSSLLYGIYALILTYVYIDYNVQQAQILANKQHPVIHITPGYLMQLELEYLVTPLLFFFLLVLIGGTLGGFLGKGRARVAPVEEEQKDVITTTATPVQEDDETATPSYSSNGARRSPASRRSRNARRNKNTN
jgi:hypothetical protein